MEGVVRANGRRRGGKGEALGRRGGLERGRGGRAGGRRRRGEHGSIDRGRAAHSRQHGRDGVDTRGTDSTQRGEESLVLGHLVGDVLKKLLLVGLVLFDFGELVNDLLVQGALPLLPLLGFVQLFRFGDDLHRGREQRHPGDLFSGGTVNACVQDAKEHVFVLGRQDTDGADDDGFRGIFGMASLNLHGTNTDKVNRFEFVRVIQKGGVDPDLVEVGGLELEENLEGVVLHHTVHRLVDAVHAEGLSTEGNNVRDREEGLLIMGGHLSLDGFIVGHFTNS